MTRFLASLLAALVVFSSTGASAEPLPEPLPAAPTSAAPDAPVPEEAPSYHPISGHPRRLQDALNQKSEDLNNGKRFLATEAMFLGNSYLASIAPKIYGGVTVILFPAGLISAEPGPERTAALLMTESLALYNLFGVDDDKMSEGQIFRANLAAWHGILLLGAVVHHYADKRRERLRQLTLVPLKDGAGLQFAGKF